MKELIGVDVEVVKRNELHKFAVMRIMSEVDKLPIRKSKYDKVENNVHRDNVLQHILKTERRDFHEQKIQNRPF